MFRRDPPSPDKKKFRPLTPAAKMFRSKIRAAAQDLESMDTDESMEEPTPSTSAAAAGTSTMQVDKKVKKIIFPPLPQSAQAGVYHSDLLYSGVVYKGFITNPLDPNNSFLEIDIKYVDFENGFLCGLIVIDTRYVVGTEAKIGVETKYFEGEIIGMKNFTFETRKWCADSEVDKHYWAQFSGNPLSHENVVDYEALRKSGNIFMRWREREEKLTHADIVTPGFFYVCLYRHTQTMNGIFFDRYHRERNDQNFQSQIVPRRSIGVCQLR